MEWLLEVVAFVGCLVTVMRMIQLKLFQVYPLLFSYLFIPLALQAVVVRYGSCSLQFCYAFPFLEPLRIIGYILLVWELASAVFRNRTGLRPWAALAPIGLILTFVSPGSNLFHGLILRIVRLERGVTCSLAILTMLLLCLIAKYSIKLPRNSVVLCTLYTIWFLGNSALLLAASILPPDHAYLVNNGLAVLEIGSYIGCTFLLSKAGETGSLSLDHRETIDCAFSCHYNT
jgi:hypothetical protein